MTTTEINQIPIRDYLASSQIFPMKEKGSYGMYQSPFRLDTDPSLKVDYNLNLFFDFGLGKGGTLIDLAMLINNCSCSEAIKLIENYSSGTHASTSFSFQGNSRVNSASRIVITQVGELNHPSLKQYLQYRGINVSIASKYIKEIHYSVADKRYFAIGFENSLKGYELRNKYCKCSNSPKGITTIDNGHSSVVIFEGFMDFLSWLTLRSISKLETNILVLNSIIHVPKAIEFIQKHSLVHCYLDNDEAGVNALKRIKGIGITEVVDHSSEYHQYKDLNEYLMADSKVTK